VASNSSRGCTFPLGPFGVTVVVRRGVLAIAIGVRRMLTPPPS
jgi:hypothetical protein